MSTLSQFFNNNTVDQRGGTVTFLGTSSSVTIPSDATYVGYGAIGAGSMGTHCCGGCCGAINNGAAGGGFSWWDGTFSCNSPVTLCAVVGAAGVTGGTSCVTGLTTITATGGANTAGGVGSGGLINTCGGRGNSTQCHSPPCTNNSYWCYRYYVTSGGGAGGLLGNGGDGYCAGGGGFGSGGGAGQTNCIGGGAGLPGLCAPNVGSCGVQYCSNNLAGRGLNAGPGQDGFSSQYVCNQQKYSTAKTFLSASGGGAGMYSQCCVCASPSMTCAYGPAGAGGGGYQTHQAGFGGGSGGFTACMSGGAGFKTYAGCGGGGSAACYCICSQDDPNYNCTLSYGCYCGGNGFVTIEYWK